MVEPGSRDGRARTAALVLALVALLAGLLTACGGGGGGGGSASGTLHASRVDPPFEVSPADLADTDGRPFSLTADTEKPLTLVFFGYTHCPDICGLTMANLAAAMTRLDDADRDRVQVVFVTTDPERDTATVLRRYLDHYDPSFTGLTGSLPDIVGVARSVAVGMGAQLPSGGYDVSAHSTQVTAVDADDRAPVFWRQGTTAAQFAADVHTLLGGSAA